MRCASFEFWTYYNEVLAMTQQCSEQPCKFKGDIEHKVYFFSKKIWDYKSLLTKKNFWIRTPYHAFEKPKFTTYLQFLYICGNLLYHFINLFMGVEKCLLCFYPCLHPLFFQLLLFSLVVAKFFSSFLNFFFLSGMFQKHYATTIRCSDKNILYLVMYWTTVVLAVEMELTFITYTIKRWI